MKILKEDALFNSNQTQYFRFLYDNMSQGVSYNDSLDMLENKYGKSVLGSVKTSIHNLINSPAISAEPDAIDMRLLLKYASKGPDTTSNPALNYLVSLPSTIWKNSLKYIESLCSEIDSGSISASDSSGVVFSYLYTPSLYSRSKNDFIYAYKAFDTLNTDKYKKYFSVKNVSGKRAILINVDEHVAYTFFDEEGRLSDNYTDSVNYTALENSTQGYFELSPRFFYTDMQDHVDGSGVIIPSRSGERNIYNYMEIWSNSITESDMGDNDSRKESNNQQRNQQQQRAQSNQQQETQQVVNRIKDIIGASKMNSQSRNELINLLNQLM